MEIYQHMLLIFSISLWASLPAKSYGGVVPNRMLEYQKKNMKSEESGFPRVQTCGGWFTSSSGSFTSPNYPSRYNEYDDCSYVLDLQGTGASSILIHFNELELEQSYDYLYHGLGTDASDRRSAICVFNGYNEPEDFVINGNQAWFRFQSDGSVTYMGFSVTWTAVHEAIDYYYWTTSTPNQCRVFGTSGTTYSETTSSMSTDQTTIEVNDFTTDETARSTNEVSTRKTTANSRTPGTTINPTAPFATSPKDDAPSADLVCSDNTLTAYIARTVIGDVTGDHLHFNEDSCVGTNHNSTHVRISTPFNQCGTFMEVKSDYVVFSNVVRDEALPITPGNVISRDRDIHIPVECHIEKDGMGSISFHADTSKIIFREEGYGKFSFNLQLYQDGSYSTPYPPEAYPIDVNLREMLYFEAAVSAEDGLELFVETCVATTTTDPYASPQYRFLEDGCAKDNTMQFFPSSDPMLERFGLEAFAFVGFHAPVYAHCFLMLCNVSDPNSRCALGCQSTVQKRDVSMSDGNSGSKSYVMTQGPLEFKQGDESFIAGADGDQGPLGHWSFLAGSLALMALCLTATLLVIRRSSRSYSTGYIAVSSQEIE